MYWPDKGKEKVQKLPHSSKQRPENNFQLQHRNEIIDDHKIKSSPLDLFVFA